LINELDSMGLVNAKVVSMGRYGRTKKIRLEISRGIIRDTFADDPRFSQLINYSPQACRKNEAEA
jgi:archaeal cell division control protein 6